MQTLTDRSDADLVDAASRVLAIPKQAPADSFVLHAPLELLARAALLARVRPSGRESARQRIAELAAGYEAAGDPVDDPRPTPIEAASSPSVLAARLAAALRMGDLDDVDALAVQLASSAPPSELRAWLGPVVVRSLGAAAHGGILLDLLGRDPAGLVDRRVIRGALREIARQPEWQLSWFDDDDGADAGGGGSPARSWRPGLEEPWVDALVDVPLLGVPGSTFIYPLMHQVEASGTAAAVLGPTLAGAVPAGGAAADVLAARRQLGRIAAWSMLQEGPEHAPYGWTHCLTMPQAVLALVPSIDARTAVAVASTYVLGFRTALGTRVLDPDEVPIGPVLDDAAEAIAEGREAAAATVWHAPDDALAAVVETLATNAAAHHDAHLVKFTLACLDAAELDPPARRLHLAAAASLAAVWWADEPTVPS
jgi:hypothetical protein